MKLPILAILAFANGLVTAHAGLTLHDWHFWAIIIICAVVGAVGFNHE